MTSGMLEEKKEDDVPGGITPIDPKDLTAKAPLPPPASSPRSEEGQELLWLDDSSSSAIARNEPSPAASPAKRFFGKKKKTTAVQKNKKTLPENRVVVVVENSKNHEEEKRMPPAIAAAASTAGATTTTATAVAAGILSSMGKEATKKDTSVPAATKVDEESSNLPAPISQLRSVNTEDADAVASSFTEDKSAVLEDSMSMTSLNAILDGPLSNENTPTKEEQTVPKEDHGIIEKVSMIGPAAAAKKGGMFSRFRNKNKDTKKMETHVLENIPIAENSTRAPPEQPTSSNEEIQRFIASVRVRDRTDLTALSLDQSPSFLNMKEAGDRVGLALDHAMQQDETEEIATFDGIKLFGADEEEDDLSTKSPMPFTPPKEPKFISAPQGRAQSLTQKSWQTLVEKGAVVAVPQPDKTWYKDNHEEHMDREIPPPEQIAPSPLSSDASPTKAINDKYTSADAEDNDDDDAYSFVESACGSFDAAFEAMGLDPGEVGHLDEEGAAQEPSKDISAANKDGPRLRSFDENDADSTATPTKRRFRIVGVIDRLRKKRSAKKETTEKKRGKAGRKERGIRKLSANHSDNALEQATTEGTSPVSPKSEQEEESEFAHIINQNTRGRMSIDPSTSAAVERGIDP